MKNLSFPILLMLTCMTMSKTTAQNSFTLDSIQLKNVYTGLKLGDYYRDNFKSCLEISNTLNGIIQSQNLDLKNYVAKNKELDSILKVSNKTILEKSVKLESVKNKKIKWYLHPILYASIGIITGVWIAK